MDRSLYKVVLECDVDGYQQFKENIEKQLTGNQNNVLHVIAQHHDSAGFVDAILLDHSSEVVKHLLTGKNFEGDTAVCIAARNNHIKMVESLIKRAQSLDLEQGSGGAIVTHHMLRMTNKIGDTALHEAVKHKCTQIVKLLVEADPDFKHLANDMKNTPLYIAIIEEYDDILESILSICTNPDYGGPDGENVLHVAARKYGGSKWINRIHEKNSHLIKEVDDRGFTPLHHAALAWSGLDVVIELLKIDRSMAYVRAVDNHDGMTPLHMAAFRSRMQVMEFILAHCPDCWDMTTSQGRSILHISAQKQDQDSIRFILKHQWAKNLINQVDKLGNTPAHLLVSSIPYSYENIKDIIEHPKVDLSVINMEGYTPSTMIYKFYWKSKHLTARQIHILQELRERVPYISGRQELYDKDGTLTKRDDDFDQKKRVRLEEMRKNAERHLVVAALIATVTFAAGFTLPGGYDGNLGPNQGMAVSIKKAAFKTFVVTNTLAVISSYAAIFLHFAATFYKHDEGKLYNRYESALGLLLFSMVTMVIAFITGMFTVLDKSLGLSITVCIIGSLGILFLLYLVYKTYQDLRSHNTSGYFRPLGIEV